MADGPRRSIDGFVPNNQGRHVGFGYDTANGYNTQNGGQQHTRPDSSARVRMRRPPGLHSTPAVRSGIGPKIGSGAANGSGPVRGTTLLPTLPAVAENRVNRRDFQDLRNNTMQTGGSIARDGRLGSNNGSTLGDSQPKKAKKGLFGKRRGSSSRRNGRNQSYGELPAKKASFLRRTPWKKVFKRTALVLGLFVLVIGGWLGYRIAKTTTKVFGGDSNVLGFLNSTTLNGEDKGRVNILLAGVSTDDPGHSGGNLTDSIMLVSLDTKNHKAFLLSIPRDLWVNIPGYGHAKINAANAFGDSNSYSQPGYPAGGMGLLEQVVSENFEVPIHYYAKINYSAFRDAVNAVGGISVNIQSSDKRGLYDPNISKADQGPLKLPNGVQTLDGQTALNLARARGDPTGDGRVAYGFARSDFDRTEHQRLMMLALKEKVTSGGVITNPLKISQLFDVIGKNMTTDLKPSEIRRLYDINKQTQGSAVESLSLNDAGGTNLLASYRSADGESALIPAAGLDMFNQIQLYLKKVMTNDPVVKEAAKVVVLNGGDITGLASKESNYLTSKGINVVAVDDAPHTVGANIIIDQTTKDAAGNSGKPGTKGRLQQIFGNSGAAPSASVGYPTADFIVILGTNQKAPQTNE